MFNKYQFKVKATGGNIEEVVNVEFESQFKEGPARRIAREKAWKVVAEKHQEPYERSDWNIEIVE